jgi:hypothetical protein
MKKKIVLLTLFSVFLLSAMTVPSLSQWTVGVKVGDWFLYESTLVEYEGEPFPPNEYMTFLQTYNDSDWQKLTVTAVSGTTITFESVTHWKNGSDTTTTIEEEITTSSELWAIGANLTVGEEVRPEDTFWGWPARIINETINTEYDGLIRETNYVPWSFMGGPEGDWPFNYEYYFDKETGILVKYVAAAELYQETGDVTFLAVNELVDLNVWVIPEYPTVTVMLLAFVAITVSIGLYGRKKLKH